MCDLLIIPRMYSLEILNILKKLTPPSPVDWITQILSPDVTVCDLLIVPRVCVSEFFNIPRNLVPFPCDRTLK